MTTALALGLEPHWWWLIAAVALAGTEIFAPGFFLIWLAAAALVTGLLTAASGVDLGVQLGIFSISALGAVGVARFWTRYGDDDTADPLLNDRTARLIGETVEVVEPIVGGSGRVRVGDGVWSARGPDAAAGTHVRIVGADGTLLRIELV